MKLTRKLLIGGAITMLAGIGVLYSVRRDGSATKADLLAAHIRESYAAAREIPEVLSSIGCFCGCMSNKLQHQSVLDCFKNEHAEGCPMCREEALDALRLKRKGKSISEIKEYIHNVYGFDPFAN